MDEGRSPVPVKVGDGYLQAATSSLNTAAIKADGTLWLWGGNQRGMFGNCSTEGIINKPVQVGEGFAQVALGDGFLVALKPDGSVWTLGWPWEGNQLDIPIACRKLAPVVMGDGISNWNKPAKGVLNPRLNMPRMPANIFGIAAGASHSAMVKADGTLWTWGNNEYGQLATGNIDNHKLPQRVGGDFKSVAIDGPHTLALKNDGRLLRWGVIPSVFSRGDFSRDLTKALAPVEVAAGTVVLLRSGYDRGRGLGLRRDGVAVDWPYYWEVSRQPTEFGSDIKEIGAGRFGSYAIRRDGSLWALSQYLVSPAPRHVGNDFVSIAVGVSHAYGIKADGSLWAWGSNGMYQLGDGTQTDRAEPVRLGEGFVQVAIGRLHGIALAADGSVWTWGNNEVGVIGDGSTIARTHPAKVGTGFAMVAAGDYHNLGLKADGTLWSWGANEEGQLGDGTISRRLFPTQIYPPLAGKGANALPASQEISTEKSAGPSVTGIRVGLYFSCVSLSNGKFKCWGSNSEGQLGNDRRLSKNPKPLDVEDVRSVAGLFGANPMINCQAPEKPCTRFVSRRSFLRGASMLVPNDDFGGVCALKNGRIRCAQRDDGGSGRWIVDGLHDVVAFDYRYGHGCALLANGRVKCWGDNQYGQLGNGTVHTDYTHYRSLATEVVELNP